MENVEPADTCAHPGRGFDWALRQLRGGGKVRRTGWNGKGMWVNLRLCNLAEFVPPLAAGNPQPTPSSLDVQETLVIHAADGTTRAWLASQADILAADWELV